MYEVWPDCWTGWWVRISASLHFFFSSCHSCFVLCGCIVLRGCSWVSSCNALCFYNINIPFIGYIFVSFLLYSCTIKYIISQREFNSIKFNIYLTFSVGDWQLVATFIYIFIFRFGLSWPTCDFVPRWVPHRYVKNVFFLWEAGEGWPSVGFYHISIVLSLLMHESHYFVGDWWCVCVMFSLASDWWITLHSNYILRFK